MSCLVYYILFLVGMVYLLLTLNTSFWGVPNINWLLRIKKRRSKSSVNGEAFPEPHGHGNPMFIMVWAVSPGFSFLGRNSFTGSVGDKMMGFSLMLYVASLLGS